MVIDAHIHVGDFRVHYPYVETRTERIVEMLREEGVDYALASSAKALLYDCVEGNRDVLAAAKQYREIIPLLVVNPWDMEHALGALERCRQDGFVGVKLHPNCHGYALSSRLVAPVLGFCERTRIPILTHSTGGDSLSGDRAIRAVAESFPELALVIGHGGIFSDREVAQVAKDHEQLYMEISVEYEAGKLERTVEMLGVDRIMFGSDCPLHHPSVMLERVRRMKLAKDEEGKILWGTAQRVYSL